VSTRAGAYRGDRPEVRALVSPGVRRVLDLGCSTGAVGAALKRDRQAAAPSGLEVVGIEPDPEAAAAATGRLDRVVEADAERLFADRGAVAELGRFDCVVAADSLEHMRDPWTVLARAVELLEPDGVVVVSLPNVRFFETFWELGVRGRWPRRGFGVFDSGHLRWFTRRDAERLLTGAGLDVVEVRPVIRIRPVGSRFDRWFAWLGRTPLRELFAFQFVLAGARRVPPRR
jgi:SAM-dependent methyltransferase